nr:immunoglobulin light chain junction region [Macaca mulatta]
DYYCTLYMGGGVWVF